MQLLHVLLVDVLLHVSLLILLLLHVLLLCGRSGFDPGRDRPTSLKQVVTASLPNARQQVRVSRVLGNDHYKGLTLVTVGMAR